MWSGIRSTIRARRNLPMTGRNHRIYNQRLQMTHADFQVGCQTVIQECQQPGVVGISADTVLGLLCEAVRCSRECVRLAESSVFLSRKRVEAVADANRRDQKWMERINEVLHAKLDYGNPNSPDCVSMALEKWASQLRDRAEVAEKAAAEMRELLEEVPTLVGIWSSAGMWDYFKTKRSAAESTDAGKGWINRDKLHQALGMTEPWAALDVLRRLAVAGEHLLYEHDCDAHGYKAIGDCCLRARAIANRLEKLLAS